MTHPLFNTLNTYEAKQVINILVSQSKMEDKYSWHWEKDGRYFVRLAYHLLYEEINKNTLRALLMQWKIEFGLKFGNANQRQRRKLVC